MFQTTEATALGTILARFWPTLLAELAVFAFVARTRWRMAHSETAGRRLPGRRLGIAGLWSVPFYVWAWQANAMLGEILFDPVGLTSVPRSYETAVMTIFVSLFYLLLLRTIGTLITHEAPATLGMTGYPRTAATAAMLSVFLNAVFFLRILSEGVAPHGLLFPLR